MVCSQANGLDAGTVKRSAALSGEMDVYKKEDEGCD